MAFRYPNPPKQTNPALKQPENQQLSVAVSADATSYDPRPLTAALAALSRDEIEDMLVNIASLETHIAKLKIAGNEDAMMHLVTDGLHRLTYFLDAVKQHHTNTSDELDSAPNRDGSTTNKNTP